MKIVVAVDSMKGSLSSMEAGNAIKKGILKGYPKADIIVKPLADGGEGTREALICGLGGNNISIRVTGPLGNQIPVVYGIIEETKTAIIEIAEAAGLVLVPETHRNPWNTTTYGVGEMILDAIARGCQHFIIGIGGSATNDGGIGMLEALGVTFYNKQKEKCGGYGRDLLEIDSIDISSMVQEIKECTFQVACDVTNPLLGENGAAYTYASQKGADKETIQKLEKGLFLYSEVIRRTWGIDCANVSGAGAGGGLGYAFLTNSSVKPLALAMGI